MAVTYFLRRRFGTFLPERMCAMEDVVVCGGGPAGLAAALWLGRYRRRTLVLDAREQRNRTAHRTHGYLGLDGARPGELIERATRDATAYPTVRIENATAERAERTSDGFRVRAQERSWDAQRLVLATGVDDVHPDISGFEDLYGTSIFHCSCCDGYESVDQDVLAIGWGEHVAGFALDLLDWGARVILVTNGQGFEGDRSCIAALERNRVEIIEERIESFLGSGGAMHGARLSSGRELSATRAFFSIGHRPRTDLALQLGCDLDEKGYVRVGPHGETSVEGVYAVGDVTPGEQLVQAAAAEGAIAGIACGMSLRGQGTAPGTPDPGPDPETELS